MRNGERDHCPYCHCKFEIIKVKFNFGGPAMVWTCPNCALARTEPSRIFRLETSFISFRQEGNNARDVARFGERQRVRRSPLGTVST